jgi:Flp pilus assembly protein TadB
MAQGPDPARRRRIGIALIALVAIVFVVQIAALALGKTVLSAVCFALLILGWFVLRSYVRRREREA